MDRMLDFSGLDLAAALGMDTESLKQPEPELPSVHIALHTGAKHFWKKAKSPDALAEAIKEWPFQDGDCYHCMTIGMVDSWTWLQFMMELQTAKYIAAFSESTFIWAITSETVTLKPIDG